MLHVANAGRARSGSCPVPVVGTLGALIACVGALLASPASADAAACRVGSVVPAAEAQMIRLVARERRSAGVAPMRHAPRLRVLGRRTSSSISRGAPFRHGSLSWGRGRHVGQNLGWTANASVAMRMMKRSPAHRANLLSRSWRGFAVGAARDCRGRIVFTLNFSASPRG